MWPFKPLIHFEHVGGSNGSKDIFNSVSACLQNIMIDGFVGLDTRLDRTIPLKPSFGHVGACRAARLTRPQYPYYMWWHSSVSSVDVVTWFYYNKPF